MSYELFLRAHLLCAELTHMPSRALDGQHAMPFLSSAAPQQHCAKNLTHTIQSTFLISFILIFSTYLNKFKKTYDGH